MVETNELRIYNFPGGVSRWGNIVIMKKSKKILYGAVISVALIAAAAIIFKALIDYHVIHIEKPYEPVYISPDNLGSAEYLEGNSAMVLIFADTDSFSWSFDNEEDRKLRSDIFGYVKIAAEWLEAEGRKYGKNLNIIYPENEKDKVLYYEARLEGGLPVDYYHKKKTSAAAESDFVSRFVDNEGIRKDYGCKNASYLIFYKNDPENEFTPFAYCCYDEELTYGYEFCYFPDSYGDYILCPSVIAHEYLHTFGAMDMYAVAGFDPAPYNANENSRDYFNENFPTDIMFSTKSPLTDARESDKIDNEITDVTAYYIGCVDFPSEIIDELRLVHSQFDKP